MWAVASPFTAFVARLLVFSFLPVVYIIVVVECLAGVQVVDELPVQGRLHPFLSLPRLLSPLLYGVPPYRSSLR